MKLSVALAQINPTVGDLAGNSALILDNVSAANAQGAHLIVFPEMIVTGYPVEDLALRPSFQTASINAVEKIAAQISGDIVAVIGYLDHGPQNAVAVIHEGKIKARYVKRHLPNYGVFDEFRNFTPGTSDLVVRIHGVDVAIAICEDIWHSMADVAARTPGLVVVPNGSPFERNKDDVRLALVQQRAREIKAPLAYVNMTGGQDDLVFDGDTIVVGKDGSLLARAPQFDDTLVVIEIDCVQESSKPDVVISSEEASPSSSSPLIAPRLSDEAEMWSALVIGLRDYIIKNRFKSALVGLSGGIDSALVAAIAIDALGAKRVNGVAMPSKYSSEHSLEDAQELADATGIHFRIIPIAPMVDAFMGNMVLKGLAEENLQARVRGTTLMGISNQEGHIVLATGNKSELAVGYSTLYGDAVGGFAPIKDIYKTDVWALATWRNEQAVAAGQTPPIPVRSITKEPSAELRPDQKDSDSLPDYSLLDSVLRLYVDEDHGFDALLKDGFDEALIHRVISLVDKAEYKRRQYPPGTKVSGRAFGKDRRLPMTSRWNEK
ncbi:MAG: NAD+ synthase [Actinobacteria bacterium]|uniref:NAD(+) synthase (glutamine-hydrolyzing) n=1 Tax=freshwater metagenome TaxID=449393 RepID=A0A6J7CE04_9ZZZZ|nr:NAD+ synthase [Actinomycetota bacterium]MSX45965.1 NAD+ synthase [Actinomycetota bacterium]MSX72373.1 NAD+ synthase [Actinomycetota bacterium]MSY69415.1 NAD+ synthase [Actinomycetota bacterium]MTA76445.1 NAD+ synthase [Actinomycetota bacterium]